MGAEVFVAAAAIVAGGAEIQAGRTQEKASKRERALLSLQARGTLQQGQEAGRISFEQSRRLIATQAARVGASGLAPVGSFAFAQRFSGREAQLKSKSIIGRSEAQAQTLLGKGKQVREAGRQTRRGALLSGLTKSIGGAAGSGAF